MVKAVPLAAVAIFASGLVAVFASGSVVEFVALVSISIRREETLPRGRPLPAARLLPAEQGTSEPNAPLAGDVRRGARSALAAGQAFAPTLVSTFGNISDCGVVRRRCQN